MRSDDERHKAALRPPLHLAHPVEPIREGELNTARHIIATHIKYDAMLEPDELDEQEPKPDEKKPASSTSRSPSPTRRSRRRGPPSPSVGARSVRNCAS